MKALYTQTNIICKLKKAFFEIFSAEGKYIKEHLFDLLLSVLCLNGFQSISYNFEHFIDDISDNKLNSYYFTMNESRIDLSQWMKNMVRIALSLIPDKLLNDLIILSIDDTMAEKYGEHFENRTKLFDHAGHNGSNYLNGHCFVSIMMSIPVFDNGVIRYLSFPVSYRMWTKEKTKIDNKNINRLTGYGESTIRKLKSDMRKKSLSEILTIRGGGRKAKSADVEKEILDEIEKGNYHTRQQIADMIKDKFNITVTVTAVSRLLKKMDSKN